MNLVYRYLGVNKDLDCALVNVSDTEAQFLNVVLAPGESALYNEGELRTFIALTRIDIESSFEIRRFED